MARIVRESPCSQEPAQPERNQQKSSVSAVDQQRQQDQADCLGVARCPWCRAPLVVRMGCAGPYWHCLCAESPFRT